jgi:hypothetical protein
VSPGNLLTIVLFGIGITVGSVLFAQGHPVPGAVLQGIVLGIAMSWARNRGHEDAGEP